MVFLLIISQICIKLYFISLGQVHRLDETSKPKALPVAHSIDYRYSTKDIPGGFLFFN